jgi:hypothetical protein
MFDDLRNEGQGFQEDQSAAKPAAGAAKRPSAKKKGGNKILGMTAPQRFVVVTLLFVMVCALGVALLVLTGSIAFPG